MAIVEWKLRLPSPKYPMENIAFLLAMLMMKSQLYYRGLRQIQEAQENLYIILYPVLYLY